MGKIKIIIGIGNPDKQYYNTRHNIGFMLLDSMVKKCGTDNFEFEKKINADVLKCPDFVFAKTKLQNRGSSISTSRNRDRLNEKSIILAKPQTFVNKSGETVKKALAFYKLKPEQILIIHDDLDIEFGNSKFSFGKDSAGHKGVNSIIKSLKTNKFGRLRMGIANSLLKKARHQKTLEAKKRKVGDFVLSRFTPTEQKEIQVVFKNSFEKIKEALP